MYEKRLTKETCVHIVVRFYVNKPLLLKLETKETCVCKVVTSKETCVCKVVTSLRILLIHMGWLRSVGSIKL